MKLRISHKTTYSYDAPVVYGLQKVRLTPISDHQQTVVDWHIAIEGGTQEFEFEDQYGNRCVLVQAHDGASEISLTVSGNVQTHKTDGVYGKIYGVIPLWHFRQDTTRTNAGPRVSRLSKRITNPAGDLAELHALCADIRNEVPYTQAVTDVTTTAEEALTRGGGVCQDHADIYRRPAPCRHGVPLCQWLPDDGRQSRSRCHSCMGRGAYRGVWLGRF
ncbi:protein containing transglutaminase-like domain, putative cysteine protease [Celeribacter marinus]|uniref:Protein containing transglutaminase-like domain, putative cysteine protease n=1 Tax=Celeribacter marinus TaxID=1397108 RepID=A0A0P0A1N6_9RHOB|nr:protein containing transglutaminase-like domain, putative cysteine protease [Celeribacter marinus]